MCASDPALVALPIGIDDVSDPAARFEVHTTRSGTGGGRNECFPTFEAYGACQFAFDHFNKALFRSRLPNPMFTLIDKRGAYGHFCGRCYVSLTDVKRRADEILLNSSFFITRSVMEVLSTLVHEMFHVEQAHFGKPSPGGYHNREWADRMEAGGLMPSNNGGPDGDRTGRRMSHYIIPGGAFERSAQDLLDLGFTWSWGRAGVADVGVDGDPLNPARGMRTKAGPTLSGKRVKYTCKGCEANAWAKPALPLICGRCSVAMLPGALK